MKIVYLISIMFFLIIPLITKAANFPNFPSTILLHDESGARNAIQISCSPNFDNQLLRCQFFQMSVSYAVNPEDLEQSIAKEIDKLNTEKNILGEHPLKDAKEMCFTSEDGKKVKKAMEAMEAGPEKKWAEKFLNISREICEAKTINELKEAYIKMIRITKQRESETCKVWPNTWEETFQYKSTLNNSYWVSKAEPSGECGTLNVSTLKKDEDIFWKYESQRVITNKEGKALLGSCKDIEERTVKYTWKSQDHNVNCKVLKFSYF